MEYRGADCDAAHIIKELRFFSIPRATFYRRDATLYKRAGEKRDLGRRAQGYVMSLTITRSKIDSRYEC